MLAVAKGGNTLSFTIFMGTGASFVKLTDLSFDRLRTGNQAGVDMMLPRALGVELVDARGSRHAPGMAALPRLERFASGARWGRWARTEAGGSGMGFLRVML